MRIEQITVPWSYWIIDDFLPEEDYQELVSWFDKQPAMTYMERQHSDYFEHRYPPEIEEMLIASFIEAISYINFVSKAKIRIQLDKMLPNESGVGPHCDSLSKKLSLVLYVGEPNKGTIIHESKHSEGSMIEWKENRAFMFIVQQGVTWHSFHNRDTTTPRCTALMNIV